MDKVRIAYIRDLNELEGYEKDWNSLIEKCPGSGPTQSYAWIHSFFRYKIEPDIKWICLFAYKGPKLVAVYPLIINRRIGIPGFYFQTFQTPYDIFHTIRVDGLIMPGYEKILELLVAYLRKSFKAIPIISIKDIPGFSPSILYLNTKNRKLSSFKKITGAENFINLPENYQLYLSGLNPGFKRGINRRLRRLTEKTRVTFRFRDSLNTNEENFEIFKEIESSGWKGKKKTSIKTRSGDAELFLNATNKFDEKSWVKWNFLESTNETIAAQLIININGASFGWKTCYNEEYSFFSPGKLLLYKYIENCYSHGELGEINFMNVNNWFSDWNVSTRPLYSLIIFPRNIFLTPLIKLLIRIRSG